MTDEKMKPSFCVRFMRLVDTRDGITKIVWFQTTPEKALDDPDTEQLKELHRAGLLHGPFATEDEAKRDAQETLVGPAAKVFYGGVTELGPARH
jgi:hypothetical protein